MNNTIVVIPARGGSKGIPKKNLVKLGKYTLLEHTLTDAYKLNCPVYVTTDDAEIGHHAQESGATVIRRPIEISGDDAQIEDAVIHVLETIDAHPKTIVVMLQPTSPFRHPEDLTNALDYFKNDYCDSMYSCYRLYPYAWDDEGKRVIYDHRAERTNRQDKFPLWVEDGAFYISRGWCYLDRGNRLGGRVGRWIHDKIYGIEIDGWDDLKQAQILYPWLNEEGRI